MIKDNLRVISLKDGVNKKGALPPETIVKYGIVIFSAVILFLIWINMDITGEVDRTSCQNSISLRGSARIGTLIETGTKAIPLRCRTEKYCITSGTETKTPTYTFVMSLMTGRATGTNNLIKAPTKQSLEECPDMLSTPNNPTVKQALTQITIREKKAAYLDFLAEQIYSCHKMVNEGNSNFMPSEWSGKNYCVICSRIQLNNKLSKELESDGEGVSYKELYELMAKKKTENGKTYLEEVYKMKDPQLGEYFFDNVIKEAYKKEVKDVNWDSFHWEDLKIPTDSQTAIITSINVGGYWGEVVSGVVVAGAVTAAIILAAPSGGTSLLAVPSAIGAIGTAATVASKVGAIANAAKTVYDASKTAIGAVQTGLKAGGAVYAFTSADGDYEYSPPSIQVYDVETLRSLGCNSFETAP